MLRFVLPTVVPTGLNALALTVGSVTLTDRAGGNYRDDAQKGQSSSVKQDGESLKQCQNERFLEVIATYATASLSKNAPTLPGLFIRIALYPAKLTFIESVQVDFAGKSFLLSVTGASIRLN